MTSLIEDRKTFLLESSRLYDAMIRLTTSDAIRRYLAFRIIVNTMAFEDLIGKRLNGRCRQIRNVLLAHKQEDDFFEGHKAASEITNSSIVPLLAFMARETQASDPSYVIPELSDPAAQRHFSALIPQVFEKFHNDFLSGFRIINNYLCFTGSSIHEVSSGPLPGVFYRYHSSMALFQLGQYLHNNTYSERDLIWTARHAKLDMLLHAQNLADSVFRDSHNAYSIDGLLEVMTNSNIGNTLSLNTLQSDQNFKNLYTQIRQQRNKLIGHIDKVAPLSMLLSILDAFPMQDLHELVNLVDKAVWEASQTHISVQMRYVSANQPLKKSNIVDISNLKPSPYF